MISSLEVEAEVPQEGIADPGSAEQWDGMFLGSAVSPERDEPRTFRDVLMSSS